jgi:hypothetical protein
VLKLSYDRKASNFYFSVYVTYKLTFIKIWDLFEEGHMFHPGGQDRKLSNARMLGEMIALLGPAPREFLRKADETLAYWNHEGSYSLQPISYDMVPQLIGVVRRMERIWGGPDILYGGD